MSVLGIREIPFISVIIVQLTRRGRRNPQQNQTGAGDQGAGSEDSPDVDPGRENENFSQQAQGSENSSSHHGIEQQQIETAVSADEQQIETIVNSDQDVNNDLETHAASTGLSEHNLETSDRPDSISCETDINIPESLSNEELRQRRLDFLNGKPKTCDTDYQDRQEVVRKDDNTSSSHTSSQPEGVSVSRAHSCQENEAKTALPASSDNGSHTNGATRQSANVDSSENQSSGSGAIRIKIKFLNDTHRQVDTNLNETIGSLRR